jgi:hypothetical protein
LANARTDCSDAMLTIRPHPRAIIAGASRCERKNGASRLTRMSRSQSSAVSSSIGLRMLTPAQLTRMSGAPKNDGAASAQRSSAARSARSHGSASACPPAAAMLSRAASSSCARRATSTTRAPAAA